ncbi:hypothetical protein BDV96DRAFT_374214 [Lophiotrema nucula]|uniref:Uncharacterized protein n=1 Tax=Lophiotrema nucula TaxID=690887 RepID=A0A6A5YEC0_9PLEO|nr:hypothetical protein BDV96DRAFT_374214 [Lophiotrema nucula]
MINDTESVVAIPKVRKRSQRAGKPVNSQIRVYNVLFKNEWLRILLKAFHLSASAVNRNPNVSTTHNNMASRAQGPSTTPTKVADFEGQANCDERGQQQCSRFVRYVDVPRAFGRVTPEASSSGCPAGRETPEGISFAMGRWLSEADRDRPYHTIGQVGRDVNSKDGA